jgi:hypothetical protein
MLTLNNNHLSRYGGDYLEYDDDEENLSALFKRKLFHLQHQYPSGSPIRRFFRKWKRIDILLFPIFVIYTSRATAHAASSLTILPDSLLGPQNILTAAVMLVSFGAIPLSLFGVVGLTALAFQAI